MKKAISVFMAFLMLVMPSPLVNPIIGGYGMTAYGSN